ncbi:MAG TPA: enoyl-CoA hydratase-related protein, partial [Vicinamibacterales bacterium]|nr:enoyl-CoA hydratase-related protein [Vicinamibacterales bacterium]
VRIERDEPIATITIDRPQARNALNQAAMDELRRAVLDLRRDDRIRAVIVTGAGDKAFVAGADIAELAELTPEAARVFAQRGQHVFDLIAHMGKPVIAAVNGFALGGGCELAMACTLRIAADTARFGQPEVNLGLIPGYGGTQRLARLVGQGRALELLLRGHAIDAQEAWRIGLVDRVVPASELVATAKAIATELASKPAAAVRGILDAVARGLEMPLADALAYEASLFALTAATEDMREGTRAFLEKRPPVFHGR